MIQGDGRFDEAAAAVAYWCDYNQEQAERFVFELKRKWRESVRAHLLKPQQLAFDFGRGAEAGAGVDRPEWTWSALSRVGRPWSSAAQR